MRSTAERTLRSDLDWLRERLASAVAAQPFAAAAAAAGIGFALGGGWTAARLALLAQAGSRFATAWVGNSIRRNGQEDLDDERH